MVQIKEVANAANVSPSTVSRVINKPELVKTETREAVYAAMEKVGYSPPKGETASRKDIIGLAISNINLDVNGEFIREFQKEIEATQYDLLLFNMKRSKNISRYFRENATLRKKIDALIVLSAILDDESVDFFRSLELPIVLMQSRCNRERSISTNNYLGALDAVNFLIGRGYQKIAFIGWKPQDDRLLDRYNGYKNALEKAGLYRADENMTAFGPLSRAGGYEATSMLMNTVSPDVIFYAADSMAYGGYQYFREHSIRIPDDISIIGFDDLEMSSVIGLTTMKQFIRVKVEMAVSYLSGRLSGEIPEPLEEEFCVTPRLIVRDSTK
jgi:LacI family transcriptional regulator